LNPLNALPTEEGDEDSGGFAAPGTAREEPTPEAEAGPMNARRPRGEELSQLPAAPAAVAAASRTCIATAAAAAAETPPTPRDALSVLDCCCCW